MWYSVQLFHEMNGVRSNSSERHRMWPYVAQTCWGSIWSDDGMLAMKLPEQKLSFIGGPCHMFPFCGMLVLYVQHRALFDIGACVFVGSLVLTLKFGSDGRIYSDGRF